MPNVTFNGLSIWTGRNATDNQQLRARLAEVAAHLGYRVPVGPTAGAGSIGSLLCAVADGDVVVVAIDDAVHVAVQPWLRARLAEVEAADLDPDDLEQWLQALIAALAEASARRRGG